MVSETWGLEPLDTSHEHTSPSVSDFLSLQDFKELQLLLSGFIRFPVYASLLYCSHLRAESKVCSRLVTPRKSSYRLRLLIVFSRMRIPVYNPMCFSRDLTHASLSVTPKRVSFHRLTRIRLLARHTHSLATLLTSGSLLPNG